MDWKEFQNLDIENKLEILHKNAVYLFKRGSGQDITLLFQMEGFYIEVNYLKYRHVIRYIYVFKNTEELEPYLSSVDISELRDCLMDDNAIEND